MICPKCGRTIITTKYAILKCVCGRTLMLIEINKVKQVVDVTPDEEG